MYNIFVIKNLQTHHQYIDYTTLSLNKYWKQTLENYSSGTSALFMSLKYYGSDKFKISILEEYYKDSIDDRMEYWLDRYSPEYNKEVMEFSHTPKKKHTSKRKWGYARVHKPTCKKETNTLKCRSLDTGKLKTLHGWDAAAKFCNGDVANIKKAVARKGTAYGYKWWIFKKAKDTKRKVYGIHKEGHITPIFNSITLAMRAMGEEDRGKGICTSIKWKQRWKGYMWYYRE